ncbi:MAG: glucose-1-phosphate cytidylyltransferase [Bacteroidota bacterium]
MKVVIFAGGLGTRLSEETHLKPKPMVEIGGKPILWHIMKIYAAQGFNEFVICLGYKGYVIKEYFINYFYHNADVTIDLSKNEVQVHQTYAEDFKVTLVETGLNTQTAGRLKRVQPYIEDEQFMLTYGDGVADIDLVSLLDFHNSHGKTCTVTAVQPEGRFGGMELQSAGEVLSFKEKPQGDGNWINGGFFVLNRSIFDILDDDSDCHMWEDKPMVALTHANELMAYKHKGFWRCMDALRDKVILDRLWTQEQAAWKVW